MNRKTSFTFVCAKRNSTDSLQKLRFYEYTVKRLFPHFEAHPKDMTWVDRLNQLVLRKEGKETFYDQFNIMKMRISEFTSPMEVTPGMRDLMRLDDWGLKFATRSLVQNTLINYIRVDNTPYDDIKVLPKSIKEKLADLITAQGIDPSNVNIRQLSFLAKDSCIREAIPEGNAPYWPINDPVIKKLAIYKAAIDDWRLDAGGSGICENRWLELGFPLE